jgi:hypothetical protein
VIVYDIDLMLFRLHPPTFWYGIENLMPRLQAVNLEVNLPQFIADLKQVTTEPIDLVLGGVFWR